jgi:hypothetical protein
MLKDRSHESATALAGITADGLQPDSGTERRHGRARSRPAGRGRARRDPPLHDRASAATDRHGFPSTWIFYRNFYLGRRSTRPADHQIPSRLVTRFRLPSPAPVLPCQPLVVPGVPGQVGVPADDPGGTEVRRQPGGSSQRGRAFPCAAKVSAAAGRSGGSRLRSGVRARE